MDESLKSRPDVPEDDNTDFSRRGFLQKALHGAAATAVGAVSAFTLSTTVQARYGRVWKTTALYRDFPNGWQRCGRCVHFIPPYFCEIVEPPISPHGWCRFFYPRRAIYGRGYGPRGARMY